MPKLNALNPRREVEVGEGTRRDGKLDTLSVTVITVIYVSIHCERSVQSIRFYSTTRGLLGKLYRHIEYLNANQMAGGVGKASLQ